MNVTIEFLLDKIKNGKNYSFYGKKQNGKIADVKTVAFTMDNVTFEKDFSLDFNVFIECIMLNYAFDENKLELVLIDRNSMTLKEAAKEAPKVLRNFLEELARDVEEILKNYK